MESREARGVPLRELRPRLARNEPDQPPIQTESTCEQNAWQGDPPFGLVLELMPDRDLKLIDPRRSFVYMLQSRNDAPDPMRMPFNDLH